MIIARVVRKKIINTRAILLFLLLSILMYVESMQIGSAKIGIIWKAAIVLAIAFYLLAEGRSELQLAVFSGYIFCVKIFLNSCGAACAGQSASEAVRYMILPMVMHALFISSKKSEQIERFLILLVIFFSISGLPFALGLISSPNIGYILADYEDGLGEGFVGLFANPHMAAMALAMASLFLLWRVLVCRDRRILVILGTIAAAYLLYKTYVRTGWVMILAGVPIIMVARSKGRTLLRLFITTVAILTIFGGLYAGDEAFRARVTDQETKHSESVDFKDRLGSGRLSYSGTYIDNWKALDLAEQLLGIGEERALDEMEATSGRRLAAHNGFVDILVRNGLIGLILYLLFLWSMFRTAIQRGAPATRKLAVAGCVAYVVALLVQGANNFWVDILLALFISYHRAAVRSGKALR